MLLDELLVSVVVEVITTPELVVVMTITLEELELEVALVEVLVCEVLV